MPTLVITFKKKPTEPWILAVEGYREKWFTNFQIEYVLKLQESIVRKLAGNLSNMPEVFVNGDVATISHRFVTRETAQAALLAMFGPKGDPSCVRRNKLMREVWQANGVTYEISKDILE